jgi:small redox-active disulfide protein 2
MTVKVLGPGCKRCHALAAVTEQALGDLGRPTTVQHVTDYAEMARYGVMSTPALVVDDRVLLSGVIPPRDRLRELLVAQPH